MGIARARLIGGPQITREFLQGWVGQSVEDFCPNRGGSMAQDEVRPFRLPARTGVMKE